METSKQNNLMKILLMIYILILIWIIVFKMQFNIKYLPYIRSINLVPFGESVIVNGKIYFNEIFNNLIVFIPVGVYVGILGKKEKFYKKVIPVLFITLIFEILQYILHVGASDITDIIMNTLGGMLGIGVINFLYKVFKNTNKTDKVLCILATICTVLVVCFIAILIIANI